MNAQRQGEIALELIKHQLFKKGVPGEGFQRDIGNVAKEAEIKKAELIEFYEAILPEILCKVLSRKSVKLETSD